MLRENVDVLEVFLENILNYVYEYRLMNTIDLAGAIVHLMFKDLSQADPVERILPIIYHITLKSFIVEP